MIISARLLVALVLLSAAGVAQRFPDKTAAPGKTAGSPRATLLNVNNISLWANDNGMLERRIEDRTGGVTYPAGTSAVTFASGLLWGGIVDDRTGDQAIRVGGQSYESGTVPGAIIRPGIPENSTNTGVRIYRVRRDWRTADLKRDASEYYGVSLLDVTQGQTDAIRGQYAKDWSEWPWQKGAPYYERNGIPGYQPATGEKYDATEDEPGLAEADQVIWFVSNDLDRTATFGLYGSAPIGLEVQVTLWAYNGRGDLDNTVFQRHRLIYKGRVDTPPDATITDMYIGKWVDPDIGFYGDDLVGCVPERSFGYAYNAGATDIEFSRYKLIPPAVGYDLLQGPRVPSPGSTAHWNLQTIAGYANLPMTKFAYFTNDTRTSDYDLGIRRGTLEWWNIFHGYNPFPVTPATCLTDYTTGACTNFEVTGDPLTLRGWVDGRKDAAGDRRYLLASGPFTMALGDTQEVVVGLVAAQGSDNRDAVARLLDVDGSAQDAFLQNFDLPQAVPVPTVRIVELDQHLILDWETDTAQVRRIEAYNSKGYRFETYTLCQFPRPDVGVSKATLFPPYDISLPRSMLLATDLIRKRPLINGQKYYYAITATMYNPDPLVANHRIESPLVLKTAVPHQPDPGVVYPYQVGEVATSDANVTNLAGVNDAVVQVSYYDPSKATGGRYEIAFHRTPVQIIDIDEKPTWDFIDVNDFELAYAVGGAAVDQRSQARTTDGGTTWTAASASGSQLRSVSFVDIETGTAVGAGGTILRTTDRGLSWQPQISPVASELRGVSMVDTNNVTAVGTGGLTLRTTDGGANWMQTLAPTVNDLRAVSFLDLLRGYAVGDHGTLIHTINGGRTDTVFGTPRSGWFKDSLQFTDDLYGVAAAELDIAIAVGANGTAVRTTNGGISWQVLSTGTTSHLYAVAFADGNTGTAVGAGGTILRTTDRGLSWIPQASPVTTDLTSVALIDSATGWAAGSGGVVLRTSDGGASWNLQSTGSSTDLYGIAATNHNRLLKGLRMDAPAQRVVARGMSVHVTSPFRGMKGVFQTRREGVVTRVPVFNQPNPEAEIMVVGNGASDLDSIQGGTASDIDIEFRFGEDSSWALLKRFNAPASRWLRVPYTVWAVGVSGKDSINHQLFSIITDAGADSVWRPQVLLDRSYNGRTLKEFYPIIVISDSLKLGTEYIGNRYYDDAPFRSDSSLIKGYLYVSSLVQSEPKSSLWKVFFVDLDEDGVPAPRGTYIRFERYKFVRNREAKLFRPSVVTSGNVEAARSEVAKVNVFPNPYYGQNKYELDRVHRYLTFSHLPPKATIRIYNLAGTLVRTITKDDPSQFIDWDLKNERGLPVGGGIYLAAIEMRDAQNVDLGEKTLKLMIVQETQY